MKLLEKIKINMGQAKEREIRLLGIPIFQYEKKVEKNIITIQAKLFPKRSLKEKFVDDILMNIEEDYDDIYIIRTGSGECFLLMYFVEIWCKKNGSKKPLFICNKAYHKDMFEIWNPKIKALHHTMNITKFDKIFSKIKNKYKKHNLYVFLPRTVFTELNNALAENSQYNLDYICEKLNIAKCDIAPLKTNLNESEIDSCIENMNLNINKDKFILISPEAISVENLQPEFWNKLFLELKIKGFDIVINSNNPNLYDKSLTVPIFCSFKELYCLSQKAKYIITMRSGLSEFLTNSQCPQFVLVQGIPIYNVSADVIYNAYDMNKLPFLKQKVYQYNCSNTDLAEIQKDIIKQIDYQEAEIRL